MTSAYILRYGPYLCKQKQSSSWTLYKAEVILNLNESELSNFG
jgi:hypothetical protein